MRAFFLTIIIFKLKEPPKRLSASRPPLLMRENEPLLRARGASAALEGAPSEPRPAGAAYGVLLEVARLPGPKIHFIFFNLLTFKI